MADTQRKTKLKLSLKKETLRELPDIDLTLLDKVVGGTGAPPTTGCPLTGREVQV